MDGLYEQFRIAVYEVWRRRWLVLAVAWGVCLLGWLVIAMIPSTYEAKAKVFVQMQGVLPTQIGVSSQDSQNDLLRVRQTLTSNENLSQVVHRTNLNNLVSSDADMANVVSGLRSRIQIVAQPDNLFEISATSNVRSLSNAQNARTAQATVQALVDLFVRGNVAGSAQENAQSVAILDQELQRREAALQQAEQRRVEFSQHFLGMLPGTGSVTDRMSAAQNELSTLDQQIVASQASLNAYRSELASTPPTMNLPGGESAPGPASAQIAALQTQLSQYQGRGFTDQHPDVIALREQISRLRPQAQTEHRSNGGSSGMTNPGYASLRAMVAQREAELAAAQARRSQIQSDLLQLTSHSSSAPGLATEQERLDRDYDVLKSQYDQLLANREQLRLRGNVQAQSASMNVRVVEPPSLPHVPSSPNRPVFLTVVLILGLGVGVGVAFLLSQLQTTFPTQNRLVEITGLPVLGTVSEVLVPAARHKRRHRLMLLAGGVAALGGAYVLLMALEFWQRSQVA